VHALTNGRFAPQTAAARHLGNSHLLHFTQVARGRTELLHVQNTRSSLTLASVVAAHLRRVPIVLTMHNTPVSLTGRRRTTRLLAWSLRLADTIIAVDEHLAADLRPHSGSTPVRVITAFIAPPEDERTHVAPDTEAWLRRHEERPLVSFSVYRTLGRPPRRRDIYGLDAMTLFAERIAGLREAIALGLLLSQPPLGDAETRYLDARVARIRSALGDAFRVIVDEPAVPIIARSSVFVRPTVTDGDSIAVREALALGVAVVASDAVPRPPGALLYALGDADELVATVRAALQRRDAPPVEDQPDAVAHMVALYEAVRKH
jgi:glycosyltransferase involved in cell wall biosynthesis